MSRISILSIITLVMLAVTLPAQVHAQEGGQARLVGRAVLPATALTDGPQAGTRLSGGATINGVKVPFDSQPVGTISSVLPGEYPGTWLALFNGQFDSPQNSFDYLLRFYVFDLDLRRIGTGSGEPVPLEKRPLADPDGKIGGSIVNANTPTRYLTGQDFSPRAFQRASDGTFWVAEERLPSLLRFDSVGKLLEPPIQINGTLQGMSILPDRSALIIAVRGGGGVSFQSFDLTTRQFGQIGAAYPLAGNTSVGGISMLTADTTLVIEIDSGQNSRARTKQIFQFNLSNGQKTLLVDLLNIDDPNGISSDPVFQVPPRAFGLGQNFKFPFQLITAVYPSDEQTLLVANNNRVPFGLGRSTASADGTEFIAVQLAQPIPVDPAFLRPLR